MALRLTPISTSPSAPAGGVPTRSDAVAVRELAARAAALLAAGDFDHYRQLFAQAGAIEHESRRYQARKLLLEQALRAIGQVPAAHAEDILVAMAREGVEVLESEPAEPVLLNYVGLAFYELWSLDAARALWGAAARLDPELPHLRRNLAELSRRRRSPGRPRRQVHVGFGALVLRARRVADRARPAKGMKLSLCMIVRDEQEMLPQCLDAVAPAVDEIVIVDTGSVDRTVEIARSYGAKVIQRAWTGSFADARNVSFDAATGDWLLYLDADEVLVAEDVQRLRDLTGQTWREAFFLAETSFTGEAHAGTGLTHNALRLFRSRPEYRFEGRLHEQIANRLPGYLPERVALSPVRVEHYGYLGVIRSAKEKSRRNIELLRAQQTEGESTPFLHFNLGSEYAAAGESAAALAEFERSWELLDGEGSTAYGFAPTLAVRLVRELRACGRHQEAIDRAARCLELFGGFTDLVFEQGLSSLASDRAADADRYFKQCIELGDAPAQYSASLGCGTYLPRIALADAHLHAGETDAALELLRWCVEHHPGFYGVVLPYATALLRSGADGDAVVAEIEQRIPRVTPTVRFMLGTALYECGATPQAEQQFRLVLEAQPHSGRARVALAETLLAQRRNAEAADAAAELAEDDPLAAIAVRSELFARIVAGDLDGARAAAERAARVGLPASERELFGTWIGLAQGGPVSGRVPAPAVPLLEVMLEALLRVQDFDAFEVAHPLVRAAEIPGRDKRELLGQIYLRRGFLQSAAREWMAVCQERPDARALAGLAQVSLAHGLREDAENFANEALTLDPACAAAASIVAAIREAVPA